MDTKWSTGDVRPLNDVGAQGKKGQGASKDTKTKGAEQGKNTAVKLSILSMR